MRFDTKTEDGPDGEGGERYTTSFAWSGTQGRPPGLPSFGDPHGPSGPRLGAMPVDVDPDTFEALVDRALDGIIDQ